MDRRASRATGLQKGGIYQIGSTQILRGAGLGKYLGDMNLEQLAAVSSMPSSDLVALLVSELDQVSIALFGASAAWLSQARTLKMRRWACVFGMLITPAPPGQRERATAMN